MRTKQLSNGIEIYVASIIQMGNSHYTAITTEGVLVLVWTNNAYDQALPDDLHEAIRHCYDVGEGNAKAGAKLTIELVYIADHSYSSDEAYEDLQWYRKKALEVLSTPSDVIEQALSM